MVYTNNNLENRNTKAVQNKKGGVGIQNLKNDMPVYPFTVDIASQPERKYLAGVYVFARFAYMSLVIAMCVCAFIVFAAYSRKTSPVFIYWNELENRFENAPIFSNRLKPDVFVKKFSEQEYWNEFFVRTYILKRFGISSKTEENERNWCDCKRNNQQDGTSKNLENMGYFNTEAECYVCKFSSASVYSTFLNNEYNAYNKFAEDGVTRQVTILDIKKFYQRVTGGNETIIDMVLGKKNPVYISSSYKVSFIIGTSKNGVLESRDALIGYIDIIGRENLPQSRTVYAASYMFNPNYDIVIRDYLNNKRQIKDKR